MTVVKTTVIGLEDWMGDLERRTEVYRVVAPLERVLAESFAWSQSVVASPAFHHTPTYVPTGRLANSGHSRSELGGRRNDVWTGEIIYDARNDQGDGYAVYEYNRGGVHSQFIDGLVRFGDDYEDALRRWLRTGR